MASLEKIVALENFVPFPVELPRQIETSREVRREPENGVVTQSAATRGELVLNGWQIMVGLMVSFGAVVLITWGTVWFLFER
jgi:hypothetical protein